MENIIVIVSQGLWYVLPALAANMAPVFAAHWNILNWLNKAIDGGKKLGSTRLLGDNKTWRGLVAGAVVGGITGVVQFFFLSYPSLDALQLMEFSSIASAIVWGTSLGLAALVGDSVKSFVKRRLQIAAGKSWIPWDQIDAIVGTLIVANFISPISIVHNIAIVVTVGIGMYLSSYIGVKIKIKENM